MSEENSIPPGDDDELQKALAAAFGDDAMQLLDADGDDDAEDEAELLALMASQIADSANDADSNQPDASDESPSGSALDELIDDIGDAVYCTAAAAFPDDANLPEPQTPRGPRYVVFEVEKQQFGLPLTGVREIVRCGTVTPLPRTPSWLSGVTNVRGQILSVTDLRSLLEMPGDLSRSGRTIGDKIILVHSSQLGISTAIVVDRVLGIRSNSDEQKQLSKQDSRFAAFASGTAVIDDKKTILMDLELLLGCSELLEFAS